MTNKTKKAAAKVAKKKAAPVVDSPGESPEIAAIRKRREGNLKRPGNSRPIKREAPSTEMVWIRLPLSNKDFLVERQKESGLSMGDMLLRIINDHFGYPPEV
jgi:hypothetical protein